MLAACLQSGDLLRVAQIRDVHLIELQIPAPRRAERRHRLVVRLAEIARRTRPCPDRSSDRSPAARRGNAPPTATEWSSSAWPSSRGRRQSGSRPPSPACPSRSCPLTRNASGNGKPPLNWIFCSGSYSSTPSRPDTKSKCQNARRYSPSVAARRPNLLLLADRRLDATILHRTQRLGGQRACLARGTCLHQLARTQQAAHMVRPERRQIARPDPALRRIGRGHWTNLPITCRLSYRLSVRLKTTQDAAWTEDGQATITRRPRSPGGDS